jgi:predicted nucleotidyltransferase
MMPLIEQHRDALVDLCRRFGVRRLDLFGSAATGVFLDQESDLDFVVAFADTRTPGYADRYFGFVQALEALFARDVDLVTKRSIQNPIFRRAVEATRRRVYERSDDEAAA